MLERAMVPLSDLMLPTTTRVARALVLEALARLREGRITLRLPDGTVRELGDPAAPPERHAHATVVDDELFVRLLAAGELGAGEAYQDGLWRADDLTRLLRVFVRNLAALDLDGPLQRVGQLASRVTHRVLRRNSKGGSARNIAAHYDLGNEFYRLWLDESMAYSCAVWAPGDTLETAQARKYERICERLGLAAGQHVLEIGSGWGGFAMHAARTRGCRVTTITVSRAQAELARARVAAAGLDRLVDVQLRDYRELPAGARFDRIVSIEMFEAVGDAYWGAYFATCSRVLAPGGLMLLQTISMPEQRFARYRRNVDWTQKHIFPGAVIPSLGAMLDAAGRSSDLVVRHVDDIGPDYAPTLAAWRQRFFAALPAVRALGFDERFLRTWELYLCFSEAAFAERTLGDLQILLAHA
jgi:cyclopropane-fatty-acyl-phospholipid synthase